MKQYQPDFERDPDRIYAGDLRACGVDIPDRIPDCASISRGSIRLEDPRNESTLEELAEGIIKFTIPIRCSEPFVWYTLRSPGFRITPNKKDTQ